MFLGLNWFHFARSGANHLIQNDSCLKITTWKFTPLKTNMFPENQWLEDVFPIEMVLFGGDMLIVRGVTISNHASEWKSNHIDLPTWLALFSWFMVHGKSNVKSRMVATTHIWIYNQTKMHLNTMFHFAPSFEGQCINNRPTIRYNKNITGFSHHCLTPRKLQYTPRAHPRQSPSQLWKKSLCSLLVKGCSGRVPVRCVGSQPLINTFDRNTAPCNHSQRSLLHPFYSSRLLPHRAAQGKRAGRGGGVVDFSAF